MNKSKAVLVALFIMAVIPACTSVGAWEKGDLGRTEMFFAPDPLERKFSDHVYFAKEASSSGSAVSGGGCGCN